MTKVWVVWREAGEYSGYSVEIVAVFSSAALVGEYIRQQEEEQAAKKQAAQVAGRGFYESWWTSFEMSVDELAVMMAHGTPREAS